MENRIYFLEHSKDFELAQKLYDILCEDLPQNCTVAVLSDKAESAEDYDKIVCEFKDSETLPENAFTYSVGQSNADICGFNFQKRELSTSIDLFSDNFMGRVNISQNSQFTEKSVLLCAAGFVAAGIPLSQVLKVINSKIG